MFMTSYPAGTAFIGRSGNEYKPTESVDVAHEDVALALRAGWTTTTVEPRLPELEVTEESQTESLE